MELVPFDRAHLPAVVALCKAERWAGLAADPERTARVLTAPGVTTVVALDRDDVIGFVELFSDGELQAYLSAIAVVPGHRRGGVATALLSEALRLAGGERVDLLSADDAVGFYESFAHRRMEGLRLFLEPGDHD